jgi:chromosome segregation ATPase
MRNSDSGARASTDNLVLTVRGDSPSRRSSEDAYAHSNVENIPEPVFYVSPVEYKMGQSESALVAEIDALKLQLKMAKTANLESKIMIEGCKNELKDKIMVVNDLTFQMEKMRKKIKDQDGMLEDQKRLVSERGEHLTRLYEQKIAAFKAQISGLEESLKTSQNKHDAEVTKWVELETEIKKRLETALEDVKAAHNQIMTIEECNQKLLAELNEQKKNVVLL